MGSDAAAGGLPVLVLEDPLVELPGGVAGELLAEVDRPRALDVGEVTSAEGDQFVGKGVGFIGIHRHLHGLDDRLDFFAEIVIGHAEDGDVDDLGMADDHVLGLLGVDVHPTGDDHVRLAVGEEDEVVVGEVADVAEGAPRLGGVAGALRLRRVVVVLEVGSTTEVDGAALTDRHLLALVVADVHHTVDRRAHGALVGQPHVAVAVDEAVALGSRVVLVDDRAEPLDHLLLDLYRARSGSMDDALQRRHVVLGPHLRRQLQQADEHGRHDLGVGDPETLDELEVLLGVEVLHRHNCGADLVHPQAEPQGSSVVEGRR